MKTSVSNKDIFTCIVSATHIRSMHRFVYHALIYVYSGKLEIIADGREFVLREGKCAFIASGQMTQLTALPANGGEMCGMILSIPLCFLCEFFPILSEPENYEAKKINTMKLPDIPNYQSLFRSLVPYCKNDGEIPDSIVRLKMSEGIYALLATDKKFYWTLFGPILDHSIDILDVISCKTVSVIKWATVQDVNVV